MAIGSGFIKVDYYIQGILGFFYIATGILGVIVPGIWLITLIIQFFIGAWQVLSGLIVGVTNKDKKRLLYLACVALYFVILFSAAVLEDFIRLPRTFEQIVGVIGIFILPIGFAIWYFVTTRKNYHSLRDKLFVDPNLKIEMEDILDSDELLKS